MSAEQARELLERIWKYNATKMDVLDYELVVMAIPRFPANIEAITSIDKVTIYDLMEAFLNQAGRKKGTSVQILPENCPRCGFLGPPSLNSSALLVHLEEATKPVIGYEGQWHGDAGATGLGEGDRAGGGEPDQAGPDAVPGAGRPRDE